MIDNEEVVFKQIALDSAGSGDTLQNYDITMSSPFIAPLTVLASKGLTWKRSKSFRTGKIFQLPARIDWKKY
jgi:hypothetical protein